MADQFKIVDSGRVGADGVTKIKVFDDANLQRYVYEAENRLNRDGAKEAFVAVTIPDLKNGGYKFSGGIIVPMDNGTKSISVAGVFMHGPEGDGIAGEAVFKWGLHK